MRHRVSRAWELGLAALLGMAPLLASCDGGDPAVPSDNGFDGGGGPNLSGDGQAPDPGCGGPATLSAIQDGIFTKSCAFGSCHGGANPAAGLDLTTGHSCGGLVNTSSCVFSNRMRVVPGQPDQSYLYHKVAGDDLGSNPDGTCAGLANGTPSRMPLGGVPLCQGQIDQIKAWITAGATCDTTASDAGTDSGGGDATPPLDAGYDSGQPPVVSITSSMSIFNAGQQVNATVVLGSPAPPTGVSVLLTASDPTVLAVPSAVFVAAGQASGSFVLTGLRPGSASVQGTTGGPGASLSEVVLGLYIAEVFYWGYSGTDGEQWVRIYNGTANAIDLSQYSIGAGRSSYAETAVQLSGTIAAGGCFVVGGPTSNGDNAYPTYSQVAHFVPNIPNGGTSGAGVGIFSVPATGLTASTHPLDSVVYGDSNSGNLVARDGSIAAPVMSPDVYPGDSLLLLEGTWVDEYYPAPNSCGQ
jgi:hypothetical protein